MFTAEIDTLVLTSGHDLGVLGGAHGGRGGAPASNTTNQQQDQAIAPGTW
jgi:hypothetical protein